MCTLIYIAPRSRIFQYTPSYSCHYRCWSPDRVGVWCNVHIFIVIINNRRVLLQVTDQSNPIDDNMSDYKLNSYVGHNIIIDIILMS